MTAATPDALCVGTGLRLGVLRAAFMLGDGLVTSEGALRRMALVRR